MKKILFVLSAILLLASCGGGYNPPSNPGYATAGFSYETSHPLYVQFINTSQNATSYYWDFGDGYTSTEKNPIHQYKSKGVYSVTLKVGGRGSDSMTKNITITEPTKCFVTGIVYEKVPKNNEYYNIRFTDDYIMFETLYWYTDWALLSAANIPYTYTLKSKKQIDFSKSEYVLRLYQNSSTSGTGKQVAKWSVYPSNLKSKYSEKTTGTSSNAKVTLLLEWKD